MFVYNNNCHMCPFLSICMDKNKKLCNKKKKTEVEHESMKFEVKRIK